jgi:hypothetical protein
MIVRLSRAHLLTLRILIKSGPPSLSSMVVTVGGVSDDDGHTT